MPFPEAKPPETRNCLVWEQKMDAPPKEDMVTSLERDKHVSQR